MLVGCEANVRNGGKWELGGGKRELMEKGKGERWATEEVSRREAVVETEWYGKKSIFTSY